MNRWTVVAVALLTALILGGAIYRIATLPDALPSEIWVLGGTEMGRVCVEPGGAEVDHGSIATNGECISLWYQASLFRKLLWRVGLGKPVDGADYDPTDQQVATEEGTWHHYVRSREPE